MENIQLLIDDGNTKVWKATLDCSGLYSKLMDLPWIRSDQVVYGKRCQVPRGMYFFGDEGVNTYKYSRLEFPVEDWNLTERGLVVEAVRTQVEAIVEDLFPSAVTFNSCLLNYYESGKDYIAFHKDKEALGDYNCVVTVSLGATRRFVLKNSTENVSTYLENGDVIIMSSIGETEWQHSVPKVVISKCNEGRISLTFRKIAGY